MLDTNKNTLNIRDIGRKVATSEAFIRASNQDGTLQLTDRNRLRKAIGVVASALTGEIKGGYMTAEGYAMNVTAKLTYIRDSLDELHHGYFSVRGSMCINSVQEDRWILIEATDYGVRFDVIN